MRTIDNLRKEMAKSVKVFKQPELGKKLLEILKPYAIDYRTLEVECGLSSELTFPGIDTSGLIKSRAEFEFSLKKISCSPFIIWLNEQPNFIDAKKSMSDKKLLPLENKLESLMDYGTFYFLEFVCSSLIFNFVGQERVLHQSINKIDDKRAIKLAMQELKNRLDNADGIHFECPTKQHVFQYLLEDLLKSDMKDSISSGKAHPDQLREFLTKNVIQQLFRAYGVESL